MQPYFFPYIGYFQLIRAVDTFVIYDDVNYIKQGWINRNRILMNGKDHIITMQLKRASSFKKINEIEIIGDHDRLISVIRHAYTRAPFFNEVFPMVSNLLLYSEKNLAGYLVHLIESLVGHLEIEVNLLVSSQIQKDAALKGEEKVLDICQRLGASSYINAIGGQELYSRTNFKRNRLKLNFIETRPIDYKQFNHPFVAWLSIIDVMMFNAKKDIVKMLDKYVLI